MFGERGVERRELKAWGVGRRSGWAIADWKSDIWKGDGRAGQRAEGSGLRVSIMGTDNCSTLALKLLSSIDVGSLHTLGDVEIGKPNRKWNHRPEKALEGLDEHSLSRVVRDAPYHIGQCE